MAKCPLCSCNKLIIKHKLRNYNILQCMDCGLLSQSPLPSLEDLCEIYNNPEYWNSPYFQNCKKDYEQDEKIKMYKWALARLECLIPEKGRILDVGCGTGVFLNIARNNGWKVTGIECSTIAVEYARHNFGFDIKEGMIEKIEIPVGVFEAITLWDVIEHFRNPVEVLSKLSWSLAPNGIILIFTPNSKSFIRQIAPTLDLVFPPRPKSFVEMIYSPLHIHYFNLKNIKSLLETNFISTLETHQFPMAPKRAGHGTPFKRFIFDFFDFIGGLLNRRYRFLIFGQKK